MPYSRLLRSILATVTLIFCVSLASAAEPAAPTTLPVGGTAGPILKKGDRLVIVGDSITQQKLYSRFIDDYLTMCAPQLDVWIFQLGWSGETAGGFLDRFDTDLAPLKPNVITTCYGMNDGGYREFDVNVGKTYFDNMTRLIQKAKTLGAIAVVGSPGAVDSTTYEKDAKIAAVYNNTLANLRDLAQKVASEQGQTFADVHDPLMKTMTAVKAALGQNVPVCGTDGVHPGPNGHLVMAYAFLKAMGFDGNLGTITVDLAGQTEATDGHKVLSAKDGTVELESTRYPFCFPADQKNPEGLRNVLAHVPFNQDLNRFTLVVKNLKADSATVTWGKETKTFSKEQLAKGINLAAEFLDNPFCETWAKVDTAIIARQNFETTMIKGNNRALASMATLFANDAEAAAAVKLLQARMMPRDESLREQVQKARTPVRHTLVISIQ